jgi:hypothetical protein
MPSKDELRSRFDYNVDTGQLLFKEPPRWRRSPVLGSLNGSGYIATSFRNRNHKVHRLIWIYHYGNIPSGKVVDHINHNRSDNRIENLRLVTHQDNCKNRRHLTKTLSNTIGVYYRKKEDKWIAMIGLNNQVYYLGIFKTKGEAVLARQRAEVEYGFHRNHGKVVQ